MFIRGVAHGVALNTTCDAPSVKRMLGVLSMQNSWPRPGKPSNVKTMTTSQLRFPAILVMGQMKCAPPLIGQPQVQNPEFLIFPYFVHGSTCITNNEEIMGNVSVFKCCRSYQINIRRKPRQIILQLSNFVKWFCSKYKIVVPCKNTTPEDCLSCQWLLDSRKTYIIPS